MLDQLKVWILDQNYSLYDTYGDEFGDLIAEIPDPTQIPMQIIDRKSTRLNSSHSQQSRMPSSA